MGADQNIDWRGLAGSTLDWWRDAGVDVLINEVAFPWLDAPTPTDNVAVQARQVAAAGTFPDDLAVFATWRHGGDAPEARWPGVTIAASGSADAALMVIVDCPEREDRAALLEGEPGRLFDNMLRAIDVARAEIRLASVAVRRPTTGRIPRDVEALLGQIARHQVSLATPKQLLALGDAASRAIVGMNVSEARGRWHVLNHKDGTVTHVLASHHPRLLLDRPACKAEAWKDLLMLREGAPQ